MNATQRLTGLAMVATLFLIAGSGLSTLAQAPATGQDAAAAKGPKYTQAEYNAEQACAAEKVPAAVIKCADDFVAKYPNSDLLVYVYPLYYRAYTQLKNPQKVIEYADKLVALGDKADPGIRYEALYARALAYASLNITDKDPAAKDLASKAREAALLGLKTLDELKKPDNMSAEDFAKQKQQPAILFNYTAGNAAMTLKDYAAAAASFKAVLALNPDDPIANYNLGRAYQAMTPPQQMDAFWYFAKAVTAKGATEAQSRQIKTYLRKLVANYQGGNVCDSCARCRFHLALDALHAPVVRYLPVSPLGQGLPSVCIRQFSVTLQRPHRLQERNRSEEHDRRILCSSPRAWTDLSANPAT